jgi:hypothetical protein
MVVGCRAVGVLPSSAVGEWLRLLGRLLCVVVDPAYLPLHAPSFALHVRGGVGTTYCVVRGSVAHLKAWLLRRRLSSPALRLKYLVIFSISFFLIG